jgi:hypothetical protein
VQGDENAQEEKPPTDGFAAAVTFTVAITVAIAVTVTVLVTADHASSTSKPCSLVLRST